MPVVFGEMCSHCKFISCATVLRFNPLFHSFFILFLLLLLLLLYRIPKPSSLFLFARSKQFPSIPSLCPLQPVAGATQDLSKHKPLARVRNSWVKSFLDTKYAEIGTSTKITNYTASWSLQTSLDICLPGRAPTTSFSSWCQILSNLL